jgi:hypothetical protein
MRNLTVCLIAFAIAFAATAVVFHSVIAANRALDRRLPGMHRSTATPKGVPAVHDDQLF